MIYFSHIARNPEVGTPEIGVARNEEVGIPQIQHLSGTQALSLFQFLHFQHVTFAFLVTGCLLHLPTPHLCFRLEEG